MDINIDQIAQKCIEAIKEKIENLKTLNVIVVGKSGVGKSTLINSLFRGDFAETGLGRPVTSQIRQITKPGYPLTIYDTPGFELSMDQQKKVKDEILGLIRKNLKTQNINEAIHCIWYCINVGANRTFDSAELEWLRELTRENQSTQVPILVVLTQAVPKKKAAEMKQLVEAENLDIIKVVPVLAQDMDFDEEYVARSYGLDQLIEVMSDTLPDELQTTLQNLQKVSLKLKKKKAQAVIAAAVATSFGEGFIPVPFSDAAVLIPTQVSMIAAITVIFGLDISKSFLTSFVSSVLGTAGATIAGRSLAAGLLKLVPGAGTAVGGVISGSTAGLLTTALGEAYIKIMEMVCKGELKKEDLEQESGKNLLSQLMKKQWKGL